MEKAPNPNSTNNDFRIAALNELRLAKDIAEVESKLNNTVMTDDDERLYVNDAVQELNEAFGLDLLEEVFDIVGHAHVGDSDGDLTGEERLVYAAGAVFAGIDIITPLSNHQVVFRFDRVIDTGETQLVYETYFIPEGELLKCMPHIETDDSENFIYNLQSYALKSEALLQSDDYLSADSEHRFILRGDIAQQTARYAMAIHGYDLISVDTDEYSSVPDSIDTESDNRLSKSTTPTGRLVDVAFVERADEDYGKKGTNTLDYTCPSLVLHDEISHVHFLVPIRFVKSIHPITNEGA